MGTQATRSSLPSFDDSSTLDGNPKWSPAWTGCQPNPAQARAGSADLLLAVGYPAVSAVLCAIGLVTFAAVSAPRRRAAGWLVLAFGSLALAMAAGSLALAAPRPALDVVTSTAYLAVLATATTCAPASASLSAVT